MLRNIKYGSIWLFHIPLYIIIIIIIIITKIDD
jgi:hypothetical protein